MYDRCLAATRICALASLLFLFKVNDAVDRNREQIFTQDALTAVKDCFLAVTRKNINNQMLMDPAFRDIADEFQIEWPKRSAMGNSFQYLCEQYEQNLRTNLKRWSYTRIRAFFRMKKYTYNVQGELDITDQDVRNALAAVFVQRDGTRDEHERYKMETLLYELQTVGGEVAMDMKVLMRDHWFRSIPMFVRIQRQINEFHHEFSEELLPDDAPRPPKIKNFIVVPICKFKLKHVKFDTNEIQRMANLKEFSSSIDKQGNCWDSLFDMTKIREMGRRNKRFHPCFLSDSVSASMMYVKPKREANDQTEKILEDLENNRIVYELGIDPGMKTWNATVRRTLATNKEVSVNKNNKVIDSFVTIFVVIIC